MMWFDIDLIIVILFLIANFVVGFGIHRKISVDGFKTYSIGDFKAPSMFLLIASFTSYIISGGIFIAILQQSYNTGISYILKNSVFQPVACAIVVFFVLSFHKKTKGQSLTLNQWMDEKFHSSFLRALIALSEFLLIFGCLVMQFKALGTVAKSILNIPPQYENLCIVGFAIFLCIYTSKGGFVAINLTNILQFSIFIIAFVSLIIFIAFKSNFFAGVWDKGVIENPKMSLTPCFKDYNTTLFTLGIWFQTLLPQLGGGKYQKVMMCNDIKKVKKSVIYSLFFTLFSLFFNIF